LTGTGKSERHGERVALRRLGEAGFFVALVAVLWTADTLTRFSQLRFLGHTPDSFRLITEQVTSAVVVLLLVPCVAWWLTRFPLQRGRLFADERYVFSDYWFRNLVIEYQKDIKIYVATVGIIAAYRYIRATRSRTPAATITTDRMVVQTGKGETIIRRDDIEYLEAARNYVTVSTGERDYLVRNTLAKLEEQLAPGQIVRTHRSYLVNIDKIREIRTTDTGGYEIHLECGKSVPLSRGYRDSFRSLFGEA
jgi:hypothetical protein